MAEQIHLRQLKKLLRSHGPQTIRSQFGSHLDPEARRYLGDWETLDDDISLLRQNLPPIPQFRCPEVSPEAASGTSPSFSARWLPWFGRRPGVLALAGVVVLAIGLAYVVRRHLGFQESLERPPRPEHERVVRGPADLEHGDLAAALWADDPRGLQTLLGPDFDVNQSDRRGRTLLHAAADRAALKIVVMLLDRQADVTKTDETGGTPLMTAAARGNKEVVAALLRHGAEPAVQNRNGDTARDLAERNGYLQVVEIIDLATQTGSVDR